MNASGHEANNHPCAGSMSAYGDWGDDEPAPYAVSKAPSVSNNNVFDGSDPITGATGDGADDVAGVTKGRKGAPRAKLDPTRLTGKMGFPKLIESVEKGIKLKGKGKEVEDIDRILEVYHYWGHAMFPRLNLYDGLQQIEKTCHKLEMKRSLKRYQDDARQKLRPKPPPGEEDLDLDADGDGNGTGAAATKKEDVEAGSDDDDVAPARKKNRIHESPDSELDIVGSAPKLAPIKGATEDEDEDFFGEDDFDFDAVDQAVSATQAGGSKAPARQDDFDANEDEEDMLRELGM